MSKAEEDYNKWQLQDLTLVGYNEKYQFTKSELIHFAEFHHQSRVKEVSDTKRPTLKEYWEANTSTERVITVENAFYYIEKLEAEINKLKTE